jgi:hypothetical protein
MRDALHLTKIANFGGTMPRPRRGSKPVSGGPRAAENSLAKIPPHTHQHRRPACQPACQPHGQKPLAVRRGVLVILPAESVLVSTTGHQGGA